jgi:hypothetical protein
MGHHRYYSKTRGGLLTALVIGLLGYYTQGYLRDLDRATERRAEQERKTQLYTELLNQREQSESKLRSEMFSKIIDSFITKNPNTTLDEQILDLELLVHNFHESLNLTPLFAYLHRKLRKPDERLTDAARDRLDKRLHDLAKEVALRQMLALAGHGKTVEFRFTFEALRLKGETFNIVVRDMMTDTSPLGLPQMIGEGVLDLEGKTQRFRLYIEDVDPARKRVKLIMEINGEDGGKPLTFWVDYFDFPMIDNTRIGGGNRIAVVLTDFDAQSTRISDTEEKLDGACLITVIGFPRPMPA